MRICTDCSKENPDYIKRCLDCGKSIDPSKKSKVKIYAVSLITAGIIIAFVAAKRSALFTVENKPLDQEPAAAPMPQPETFPIKKEAKALVQSPMGQAKPVETTIIRSNEKGSSNPIEVVTPAMPRPDESKNTGPKPRKRIQHQALDTADILAGTSPSSINIKGPPGGNLSGIKSASEAYMRMLHHAIVKEYTEGLAKQGILDERGERSLVTVLVHSRSSEIELLSLSDDLDNQKKEILRKVIRDCSGKILCPQELTDDMGELVKLDFPLAINSS